MCDFKSSYDLSQTNMINEWSIGYEHWRINLLFYTEIINEIKSIHKLIILVRSCCCCCDNEQ
jgi:hypothetical protein